MTKKAKTTAETARLNFYHAINMEDFYTFLAKRHKNSTPSPLLERVSMNRDGNFIDVLRTSVDEWARYAEKNAKTIEWETPFGMFTREQLLANLVMRFDEIYHHGHESGNYYGFVLEAKREETDEEMVKRIALTKQHEDKMKEQKKAAVKTRKANELATLQMLAKKHKVKISGL